jgi:hypothetical protein
LSEAGGVRRRGRNRSGFDNAVHIYENRDPSRWARINSAVRMSPAMTAGITDKLIEWTDLVKMIHAYELEKTSK